MANKKKLIVTIEKSKTGFSAYSAEYPVSSTGASMSELMDNCIEAFSMYFEDEKFDPARLSFEIGFKQFFQFYKVINSKALAEKIGMNPTLLSQYVRGHKKPSGKQSQKILYGINRIGQELAEMRVVYEKKRRKDEKT